MTLMFPNFLNKKDTLNETMTDCELDEYMRQ